MYRQYELSCGNLERVCWLDNVKLKKGQRLTLKKDEVPDRVWTIKTVYEQTAKESQWRTWNVGGLKGKAKLPHVPRIEIPELEPVIERRIVSSFDEL